MENIIKIDDDSVIDTALLDRLLVEQRTQRGDLLTIRPVQISAEANIKIILISGVWSCLGKAWEKIFITDFVSLYYIETDGTLTTAVKHLNMRKDLSVIKGWKGHDEKGGVFQTKSEIQNLLQIFIFCRIHLDTVCSKNVPQKNLQFRAQIIQTKGCWGVDAWYDTAGGQLPLCDQEQEGLASQPGQ